jgi:hypothetical protein
MGRIDLPKNENVKPRNKKVLVEMQRKLAIKMMWPLRS